jgi:exopolyphosphatase / guanosine-5'-triphosphate,3'-diphosphate pyrophosphatase
MEIAVLDLGSTTFHLQHLRMEGESGLATSLDEKRAIVIGNPIFAQGFLDRRSWLESLNAVRELLEMSRKRRPDCSAVVATSAIRSASNGQALVREIERSQRVAVRVLEPEQEARLSYQGLATSPVLSGRRVAAVDLGGGSLELAVGEGRRCVHAASLPLGAVRMLALQSAGPYTAREARQLEATIRVHAGAALSRVRAFGPEIVVFGSGTARAARKLLMRDTHTPGKSGPIDREQFRALLQALLGSSQAQLAALGVDAARAPSVLLAATIMVQVLELLGVEGALVSDRGLREGVAIELYRERADAARSNVHA